MVLFKINGERNSGTTFLSKILRINGFPVYDGKVEDNTIHHWKHAIPRADVKDVNHKVIDLFIFRNLEDWLVSMYKNPYHIKRMKGFDTFLTNKQASVDNFHVDYQTKKSVNVDDNGKTIFEIRYHKFKSIMDYAKTNKDVILLNLEFLQNESNLLHFLQQLNSTYLNAPRPNYITKIPHTKTNELIVNREYDVDVAQYQPLIDQYKNRDVEAFIKNLKVSSNRITFEKKRLSMFS